MAIKKGMNSFLKSQIDLTRGGWASNFKSIANDFNLRAYDPLTGDTPLRAFGARILEDEANAGRYAYPVLLEGRTVWSTTAASGDEGVKAAVEGWKNFAAEDLKASKGPVGNFLWHKTLRDKMLKSEKMSVVNQFLARLGGAEHLIAPGFMFYSLYSGAKDGYREDGALGAVTGATSSLLLSMGQNYLIGAALGNPVAAAAILGGGGALLYSSYKIFDVKNQGNQYLKQGRMGGLSWNSGPTPGMSSQLNNTIRQRGIQAIEASRFNSMKALGNESYMYSSPLARYSNPAALNRLTPLSMY